MESEKLLENKLREKIKHIGGWSIKLLSTHINGLPDRMCLMPNGKIFFAEIKGTGLKPSPVQRLIHKKLRKLGFRVEVIDNSEQIISLIKEYEIHTP